MMRFSWVWTGQLLRQWMTKEAKAVATDRVIAGEADEEDVDTLREIGIRLEDMAEVSEEEDEDTGTAEGRRTKRKWDRSGAGRMRAAKDMREASDADDDVREQAAEWCDEHLATGATVKARARHRAEMTRRRKALKRRQAAASSRHQAGRAAAAAGGGGQTEEEDRITAIMAARGASEHDREENGARASGHRDRQRQRADPEREDEASRRWRKQ